MLTTLMMINRLVVAAAEYVNSKKPVSKEFYYRQEGQRYTERLEQHSANNHYDGFRNY